MLQNPHRYRQGDRRGHGEPGRSTHERRQGAAIARQLARGLRQSKTLFAQQQPHRIPSVQNSPSTSRTAPLPVQNSPSTPEMAQFGAFSACRESFVPFSPPRSRAGRILYRTRGRVGASPTAQHAPCGRRQETTGPGRGAGFGRLVGPARVGGATAQTSFAHNFPRSLFETTRKRCNPNDTHSMFEQAGGELRAKLLWWRRGLAGLRDDTWSHTSATRPHWCGGRRRVRRARLRRTWAAAGPGRASRRRAERSSRRGRLAGTPPPTGAQSSPAPSTHTKTPTRNRVGVSEPPVGIEPTTYSLRVNRSAD